MHESCKERPNLSINRASLDRESLDRVSRNRISHLYAPELRFDSNLLKLQKHVIQINVINKVFPNCFQIKYKFLYIKKVQVKLFIDIIWLFLYISFFTFHFLFFQCFFCLLLCQALLLLLRWLESYFFKKQPPECSVRKGVLRNFAKFTVLTIAICYLRQCDALPYENRYVIH